MADSTENQDSQHGEIAGADPVQTGMEAPESLDVTQESLNGPGRAAASPRDTTRANFGHAALMFAMGYGLWWAVSRVLDHMLGGRFPESLQLWMMALLGVVALCFALSNLGEWIEVLGGLGMLVSFVGGVGLLVAGVVVGLNAPSLDSTPTSGDTTVTNKPTSGDTTVTNNYTIGDAARDFAPQVCEAYDQGASGPEIAQVLVDHGAAPADAAAVVAVAIAKYC